MVACSDFSTTVMESMYELMLLNQSCKKKHNDHPNKESGAVNYDFEKKGNPFMWNVLL